MSAEGGANPGTKPEPSVHYGANLLIVAAAGNNGSGYLTAGDIFPRLSSPNCNLLIVGALQQDGTKADYSNFGGTNVQLFAPGNCLCGLPGQLNGTSQAVPVVTIAAAALASAHPEWYATDVMWRLLTTADRESLDHNYAFAGVLNLRSALSEGIVVRSDHNHLGPGDQPKPADQAGPADEVVGTQIAFDQEWTNSILRAQGSLDPHFILLRITDRTIISGQVCFNVFRYLQFQVHQACVSQIASITLTTDQGTESVQAKELRDVILPMDRSANNTPPLIGSSTN